MANNLPVTINVKPAPRGIGSQQPATFVAQSMTASFAWGSSPGTATLIYVGNAAGIQTGSFIELSIGAYFFAGICKSDVLNVGSSEGTIRTLQFVDLREFLKWDYTFCCFNRPDVRFIGGVRQKRYKHVLPTNYAANIWTYTDLPINADAMMAAIFSGPKVQTAWNVSDNGLLDAPIYDFDCLNGKRLDAAINEVCERSGCVIGLFSTPGTPYNLVFTRKGYGQLPTPPANSDNRRIGVSLTEHPNNVTVLGERNLYQVMDVPMQPDWARGWEQFISFELFADDIYHRLGYDRTPNDPEQYVGRQLANAKALTITVREYAALRADQGAAFTDTRKFAGRWRMDMPAALYISSLLFKAFRPADGFTLLNSNGIQIPLTSAEIADRLLCQVYQSDPTTGQLEFNPNVPADGNGYAIAKGYMVGADLFKSIRSEQFSLNFFANAQNVWEPIPFQIDDSGEGVRFIVFNEPIIVSRNLIVDVDGRRAINAQYALDVPPVVAALVFEAERFSYLAGGPGRQTVENVSGLNLEMVLAGGQYTEIPYANGVSATSKAQEIAEWILLSQVAYAEGGFKLIWVPGTSINSFGIGLSSMIDRVQITTGPREGTFAIIDYTSERQRDHFEPERELDRRTQTNSLFPGQAELRTQANTSKNLAAAFRQLPQLGSRLRDLLTGALGSDEALDVTWFDDVGSAAQQLMPLGTVIRKPPTQIGDLTPSNPNTNTLATDPTEVSSLDSIFLGVTVRHNEDPTKPFKVQRSGVAPCRVMGPVNCGDAVGLASHPTIDFQWQYLVAGSSPIVGRAQGTIGDSSVQVIMVDFGASGTSSKTFCIVAVYADYFACFSCDADGTNIGNGFFYIAKERLHRESLTKEFENGDEVDYTYRQDPNDGSEWEFDPDFPADTGRGGLGNRIRHKVDAVSHLQEDAVITPPWRLYEIINAIAAATGVFADTGQVDDQGNPIFVEVTLLIVGRSSQWTQI